MEDLIAYLVFGIIFLVATILLPTHKKFDDDERVMYVIGVIFGSITTGFAYAFIVEMMEIYTNLGL